MSSAPAEQPPDDGPTVPGGSRRGGNALPAGARLAEFRIRSVIGEGGFGIVYLAWDGSLKREVAIKEYMPATLAARTHGDRVAPRTDRSAETFAMGLRSFVNEAHLLASFDHRSLLKVYRFWEANGTAYMVMPYYRGVTLKRALAALDAPPDEAWLRRLLGPLLDALDTMHRAHCFHRDIAPDNVLLLDDGTPLLLDFGAARRVIGDATHALTAFLKPGYAPVEQYAEMPSMKQGPWTDLYALGSVVHYAISGHTPPESVARLVNDTMVPLERSAAGRYSERFLRAIDHALAVRPDERPQSAVQLRDELGIEEPRVLPRKAAASAQPPLERRPKADEATLPPPRPPPQPQSQPQQPQRQPQPQSQSQSQPQQQQQQPQPQPAPQTQPRGIVGSPQRLSARPSARWVLGGWLLVAAVALTATVGLGWRWLSAPGTAASAGGPQTSSPTPAQANDERALAPPAASVPEAAAPRAATTLSAPVQPEPAQPVDAQPAVAPTPGAAPLDDGGAHAKPAPAIARPTPRKNSPSPRCTEIIARVSLGETLGAEDRATLERECRK